MIFFVLIYSYVRYALIIKVIIDKKECLFEQTINISTIKVSKGLYLLNKPTNFFPVLLPFFLFYVLVFFLLFIQSDNIVLGDFYVDDFSLTQKWIHHCQIPGVLTSFYTVVLIQLLFEVRLWSF